MGVKNINFDLYVKGGAWPLLQGWRRLLFFNKNNGDKFSTENPEKDLMDLLIEKTISVGHMLSFEEASKDPEMVQPNNYAYYFGSFGEAAEMAWRRTRPPNKGSDGLTEYGRKVVEALRKTRQITGKPYRREVNWMSEFQEKKHKGKGSRYTAEEVREALINFYNRTGKLPNQSDVRRYDSGLPSWPTLVKLLGPKENWPAIVGNVADASSAPEEAASPEDTSARPEATAEVITDATVTTGASQETVIIEDAPEDIVVEKEKAVEPVVSSEGDDGIKVETTRQKQDNLVTIETKITLPDRKSPIFITLAV